MRVTVKLYATLSDYLPAGSKNNRLEVEAAERVTVNAVLSPFLLPPKETIDQRYLVQQNKLSDDGQKPPVFAKVMRSKDGKFEGVACVKNK